MKKRLHQVRSTLTDFWRGVGFTVKSSWSVARGVFIAKVALYVSQGLLPLVLAYLGGRLIDGVIRYLGDGSATSGYIFGILTILAAVQLIYNQSLRWEHYLSEKFYVAYAPYLQTRLQTKFAQLDHQYYEDANFNKQVNKIRENFRLIYRYMDELIGMVSAVVQIIASGITIFFLSPMLTVLVSVGLIPLLRVQMVAARERWRVWDTIDEEWRLRYSIQSTMMDTREISEVKIFTLPRYFTNLWLRFFKQSEAYRMKIEKSARNRQLLASMLETVIQLGAIAWLITRVLARAITVGQLEFYRRVINDFSNASSRLIYGLQTVNETGLYLKDYLDVMELEPNITMLKKPHNLDPKQIPSIEFKDVSFKYPGTKKYVLKNLNLAIKPGEDIALIGRNGAGKTTIIKLLMRFYDVSEGQILINGINIKDIDLEDWYKQVGALFQEFNYYQYFKARRSIGVGHVEEVDDLAGIKLSAKDAGIHEKLEKLPQGYETILSKVYREGTTLSGGEWQKIALARAFFRDANILILDEPTASIDAKGEYEIFNKIAKTQAEKTTIIISHRFSTVRNADKIYVIDKGLVTEQGSHEQLMKIKEGTYKQMFELQAAGYK